MTKKNIKKIFKSNKVMYAYIALFCLACVYVGILIYFSVAYENKFYPGTKIYGISVDGKTKDEAKTLVGAEAQKYLSQKINFVGSKTYTIDPASIGLDLAVARNIDAAYAYARDQDINPFKYFNKNFGEFSLDSEKLSTEMQKVEEVENVPMENAQIKLVGDKVSFTKDKEGRKVVFGETIYELKQGIGVLRGNYPLELVTIKPEVTEADAETLRIELEGIVAKSLTIKSTTKDFILTKAQIAGFITLVKKEESDLAVRPIVIFTQTDRDYRPKIAFDSEKIEIWVKNAATQVDANPQNLRLDFVDGKMIVKTPSVDGRKLKSLELVEDISLAFEEGSTEVEMPIEVTKATVGETSLAELGITTMMSQGYSDFTGSPKNRVHNFRTGAAKFDGVLIKPGEVFSFNETLGPVEASTGYLPELVILQDKTVPQYGGGLCQVSSTAFRAALNAGLPILERTRHAYPVSYYKPFGVDATIYLPKPDLVFKNDTKNHIWVQTHFEGTKIYFDFFGTKKEGSIKFAGNKEGTYGAAEIVEKIQPGISEAGARGRGSFTAVFYRFLYDGAGKMIDTSSWTSKYDSPDNYPH